jgi:hypothetical protein
LRESVVEGERRGSKEGWPVRFARDKKRTKYYPLPAPPLPLPLIVMMEKRGERGKKSNLVESLISHLIFYPYN